MNHYLATTRENPGRSRRSPPVCETPGCHKRCSNAFSCYERRMGESNVIFWPGVGFALFLAFAGILAAVS